jgi:hypothetical protein
MAIFPVIKLPGCEADHSRHLVSRYKEMSYAMLCVCSSYTLFQSGLEPGRPTTRIQANLVCVDVGAALQRGFPTRYFGPHLFLSSAVAIYLYLWLILEYEHETFKVASFSVSSCISKSCMFVPDNRLFVFCSVFNDSNSTANAIIYGIVREMTVNDKLEESGKKWPSQLPCHFP